MKPERKSRLQNLGEAKQATEKREDYLACILELWEKKGYARAVDVANSLSVAEASACSMIKSLANTGYLKRERYRGFTLTENGRAMAREIHVRRRILTAFLQSLGLPESVILHDVHAWNTISASERLSALNASFKKIADQNSRERLTWFFSRWFSSARPGRNGSSIQDRRNTVGT